MSWRLRATAQAYARQSCDATFGTHAVSACRRDQGTGDSGTTGITSTGTVGLASSSSR